MTLQEIFISQFCPSPFDETRVSQNWDILEKLYKSLFKYEWKENTKWEQAILNLIAHLFAVYFDKNANKKTSGVGNVVLAQAQGTSVQFAQLNRNSQNSNFYNSTKYGQLFLLLTQDTQRCFSA